jgi:serpin B
MRQRSLILFGSLLLSFVFVACEKDQDIPVDKNDIPVEDVQQVADANRAFGLELFQKVVKEESSTKNVLISPLSIHTAMNMAVNGAAGETKSQMLNAMHSSDWALEQLNEEQANWRTYLKEQSGHPTLIEANAVFKDPNRVDVKESFNQSMREYYSAEVQNKDFSDEQAKNDINAWVKENTQEKIDGIIDNISPNDIAFLLNAIYYKADWSRGFDEERTQEGYFNTGNGDSVSVDYINADRNFTFTQTPAFMAVDLPFKDSTYSLTLLRPKDDAVFIQDWIQGLTVEYFDNLYENMQFGRAQVFFPKMDLSYKTLLNDPLTQQGMVHAFDKNKANFAELGQPLIGPNIYISKVNHKSVLKIDEKGAEGAAVTSVGFSVTSLPPTLKFDRPFLLVLRHIETNSLVFIGSITNPDA